MLIEQFYTFRTEPAYSAIWSGVEAMPELQDLDLRELYNNASDLDARLQQEYPNLPDDRRWNASLACRGRRIHSAAGGDFAGPAGPATGR